MAMTRHWVERWRDRPDAPVLISGSDGTVLNGVQVDEITSLAASQLARLGVSAGDRVLLSCPSSIETVLAYVAVLRLGAVVVPANTAYTGSELAHVVTDCAPRLAIIDHAARLAEHEIASVSAQQLISAASTSPELVDVALDDPSDGPAMIAYTSGTTGKPKGALLSRSNLLAGASALVQAWAWTKDDVLVHALPMFHMHGLGAGLNGTFTAGASLVVVPRFEVQAVVDAIESNHATMFFGVPTMYARFHEQQRLSELNGLRLTVSGSAPLDPVLFKAIENATQQAPIERYGMSETVMLTSNPLHGERKAGSVGLPLPDVDVRLGADDGVEVRGPNVFGGYWGRPEATAEAFTKDGWFKTGDVGSYDDDGYLYLVGRASDLIITGGYNVYPREVEDVIREFPDVLDIAVVGLPDATWGERVAAFYVTSSNTKIDEGALAILLESRLAAFKHPRMWIRVDELPRNAMGKVRRDLLRDQGMM